LIKIDLHKYIIWLNLFLIIYVFIIQTTYFSFLLLAIKNVIHYIRTRRAREIMETKQMQFVSPISLVIPAYNEEITIITTINGFLQLNYPDYEIIVINDGSKDKTLEVLVEEFHLIPMTQAYAKKLDTKNVNGVYHSINHPNLIVIDKENGGKADAINAGINMSKCPLFCVVDADSILEEKSLLQVVYPFVENPEEVVAVGGIIRIVNGCDVENSHITQVRLSENRWAKMQVLEYLRAFLIGRIALSEMRSLLVIAGAFGIFKKSAVIEVGGFLTDTVGEDMELTIRLHRHSYEKKKKWKVLFIPNPVCWTQVPENRRDLKKQRNRWYRGLTESLWQHKRMLLNPRYGITGLVGMPYLFFVELLGPLIELLGLIVIPVLYFLNLIDFYFLLAFFAVAYIYSQIVSVGALILEEYNFRRYKKWSELITLFVYSFVENFVFRPLNNWWKLQALFTIRKQKKQWGELERTSIGKEPHKSR
jgi:cellulose synthase/poly-beta-1,6-N-acetylglucosamine synthase-like glycosyltransferase